MTIWVRLRRDRDGFAGPPARRRALAYLVVLRRARRA